MVVVKILKTNHETTFIQLKTIQPVVGSGKIRRRLTITKPRKARYGNRNRKQHAWASRNRVNRFKTDDKVDYGKSKVKRAFNHWCSLGFPMIAHRPDNSKVFVTSILLLKTVLEKYSLKELCDTMNFAYKTFNSGWFVHRRYFKQHKISLPQFIRYSAEQTELLPKSIRGVKSWLEEFRLGEDHIRRVHSLKLVDRNQWITDLLETSWTSYIKEDELTADDRNALIKCSKSIIEFSKLNEDTIGPLDIAYLIDAMLNRWEHKYKPKHVGWLTTPIFWETTIPKALIKNKTFDNLRDINLM